VRYLPHTEADRAAMLASIGVGSVDELFRDVPEQARMRDLPELPRHKGELDVERQLAGLADKNVAAGSVPSFLGAGAYRHHIPASVDHLVQRSEFLTAYTPYQPEISQGTLQMLFEFQTQVALITGMEVANASMYEGASACAEAVMMANRITRRKRSVLSGGLHPQYRETARNQAHFTEFNVDAAPADAAGAEDLTALIDDETSCVVVQNPSFFGHVRDLRGVAEVCHAHGALLIAVVTEAVSLGALTSPGDMGADIVVAEGQSLGNALNFGGPYLGLIASRERFVRQMPGRLCGETVDEDGRRGFVLTLSTREQHIRREKATSNICTNSGLAALAFSIHLSLLGEDGFTRLAALNHANAINLADRLAGVKGVDVVNDTFFNEFTVRLSKPAAAVTEELAGRGILAGVPVSRLYPEDPGLANLMLVASTETNTESDREALAGGLERVLS
jgi:glycine dehydrogenase subunit 1